MEKSEKKTKSQYIALMNEAYKRLISSLEGLDENITNWTKEDRDKVTDVFWNEDNNIGRLCGVLDAINEINETDWPNEVKQKAVEIVQLAVNRYIAVDAYSREDIHGEVTLYGEVTLCPTTEDYSISVALKIDEADSYELVIHEEYEDNQLSTTYTLKGLEQVKLMIDQLRAEKG